MTLAEHRQRRKERFAAVREALKPEGLGWLKSVTDPTLPSKHPDLTHLSRFQKAVLGKGARRRPAITMGDRIRLADWAQMPPDDVIALRWTPRVTVATAEVILKLSISARLSPADMVQILLCYGLEHLAKEMRERGSAPPPRAPERQIPKDIPGSPSKRAFIGA